MSLNPWLALIFGILIGWLLEWLLERWFFRNREQECQRRLTETEAQLQARELELHRARAHAESLEIDLTGFKAQAATGAPVTPPVIQGEAPGIEAEHLQATVGAPQSEVDRPQVALPAPMLKVDLPAIAVEAPQVDLQAPKLEVKLPEAPAGGLDLGGKLDGMATGIGAGIAGVAAKLGGETPEGRIEAPVVEEQLPPIDFDRLNARVEAPEIEAALPVVDVELPKIEAALPAVDVELPKVGVGLPKVEATLPKVDVELPKIEAALPAVNADLPQVAATLPSVSVEAQQVEVSIPQIATGLPEGAAEPLKAEVVWPEISATLGRAAGELPDAGVQMPAASIGAELPSGRVELPAAAIAAILPPALAVDDLTAADDLTRVEGIGPVYAAKLSDAGITTFAQLATTDTIRLAEIIQAPAWRRVNYGEWIEQARLAAAGDEAGLKALQDTLFSRQGDKLDRVSSIGAKTAVALTAAGIDSYAALAATTPERLAEITSAAGVRGGDFAAWIDEAKLRSAGKRVRRASPAVPSDPKTPGN